jgi:hypothetical protein
VRAPRGVELSGDTPLRPDGWFLTGALLWRGVAAVLGLPLSYRSEYNASFVFLRKCW